MLEGLTPINSRVAHSFCVAGNDEAQKQFSVYVFGVALKFAHPASAKYNQSRVAVVVL